MNDMFPVEVFRLGPLVVTDSVLVSVLVSVALFVGLRLALRFARARELVEVVYELLEGAVRQMVTVDPGPLVPLVLTLWLFILASNLVGLVPGLAAPTRDLSLTSALAVVAFAFGHGLALRRRGLAYLKDYVRPSPLLLPFNVVGEISRTVAMSLRLFGNMLSGTLIGALLVSLVGPLIPLPMLALSVLTAVVQAYIFGVLTLVFAASALEVGSQAREDRPRRGARRGRKAREASHAGPPPGAAPKEAHS